MAQPPDAPVQHQDPSGSGLGVTGESDPVRTGSRGVERFLTCSKQLLPDDWHILEPAIASSIERVIASRLPPEKARRAPPELAEPQARAFLARCVAAHLVELANRSHCPLVNRDAERLEGLWQHVESCKLESFSWLDFLKTCEDQWHKRGKGGPSGTSGRGRR